MAASRKHSRELEAADSMEGSEELTRHALHGEKYIYDHVIGMALHVDRTDNSTDHIFPARGGENEHSRASTSSK
ncbi:hypothetical protein QJS04_geneDACA022485 [Acorus gramineus]|uniref:Uncharacterized protein n=1 Tax=Acorus gramineus TaxID=55184 RepID=A0AAV9BGA0_ACOGR|nr:hypothetical protein QJS04_geneDACA022485 [Acorus gramineus]